VGSDASKVPGGRLGRISSLARVGLRTGANMLLSRESESAAKHAADVLGRLRGLAAKIGQMASYIDGFVPEGQREHFENALRGLRAGAPSSPSDAIIRVVERELGAPISDLYAEFDPEPFASASIGQVHRARLADGRDVAVKVQHPGIERAIDADLANGAMLESLLSVLGPKALDSRRMYAELAARVREELDYELEAKRQQEFARIHCGDGEIHVPGVIADRSTRRVLTAELMHGESFEWAAMQSPELRRHFATVLWRYVYRGNLVGGLFNADPHPGNYMFRKDGSIAFLDYGCVQPIGKERMRQARALHLAARRKDEQQFQHRCVAILGTHGGPYEAAAVAHSRLSMEPLFSSPFHVTREYVAQMVKSVWALKDHAWSGDKSFTRVPEGLLFMNRLQFGFYSVLARLDTPVDYRAAEEQMCRDAKIPELVA
jgi:predicted unusual protein kinase regulating ubiquinone biosynthesis (AarF/ABC1/UbiB family)